MTNSISLRIKYKNSSGKDSTLAKAKFAHVYIGRKKLGAFEFSKVTMAQSSKKRLLTKEINKFLSGLLSKKSSSKKKDSARLKKPKAGVKRAKASPTKKSKKSTSKKDKKKAAKKILIKKDGRVISDLEGLIKRERLDRANSWKEKPKFRSIYGDVRFTPFIPETDFYKKLLVQKKVRSQKERSDLMYLEIMDYKLKKKFEISETNIPNAIAFIRFHFFPHIDYFIRKFANKDFIFRITFMRFDDEGNEVNHGYSGSRFRARHMADFELLSADYLLNPKKFLFSEKLRNSYIRTSLGGKILLTGFTLEAVTKVHKNYFVKE